VDWVLQGRSQIVLGLATIALYLGPVHQPQMTADAAYFYHHADSMRTTARTAIHSRRDTAVSPVQTVDLAGQWSFTPVSPAGPATSISVPGGGWYTQGFTNTGEAIYQRSITIPDTGQPQIYRLEFGAINHEASLYVDGHYVQTNMTSYTPSIFDITHYVSPGETVAISLDVKSKVSLRAPDGRVIVPDGADGNPNVTQGIFRSATLRVYPQIYISDVFIQPSVKTDSLTYDVWVTNGGTTAEQMILHGTLSSWNGDAFRYPTIGDTSVVVPPGQTTEVTVGPITWGLGSSSYWWPNVPYQRGYVAKLHTLTVGLQNSSGMTSDVESYRFGFRSVTQDGTHYLLNGIPFNLRGENLAGSDFDYVSTHAPGDAAHVYPSDAYDRYAGFLPPSGSNPGWPQAVDNLLRLNCNGLRMHQFPASPYMLDVADEKGLLVIDEVGIAADQNWVVGHDNMVSGMRDLVLRDRNHPSVIHWSEANEPELNPDDSVPFLHDLYNTIVSNDPTRPVSIDTLSYADLLQKYGFADNGNFNAIPHYTGGIGVYSDQLVPFPGHPLGEGEYIYAPNSPQKFMWLATATQAMRLEGAADLRPFAFYQGWIGYIPGLGTKTVPLQNGIVPLYGEDNLPDPFGNSQIQRVQAAYNPVLVADKDYWDANKLSDASGAWPSVEPSLGHAQSVTRTLDIYNDTFSGTGVDVSWEVRVDSPEGPLNSQGSLHVDVPLGSHSEQTISFVTPAAGTRFYLVLVSSKNGQEVFRERSESFLLVDPTPTTPPTSTPTTSPTSTSTPTTSPTSTPIPTATSTNTPIPTATSTNTPIPTTTSTNTPTTPPTSTPAATALPTNTPTTPPTNTPTTPPANTPTTPPANTPTTPPANTPAATVVRAIATITKTAMPKATPHQPQPPRPTHPTLTVDLHLIHGTLAGDSRFTVATQTRPHTAVKIVLALTHPVQIWTGKGRKRHKVTVTQSLYQTTAQVRADAKGHVSAILRFGYNPTHSVQGTLMVVAHTVTGTTARAIRLTIVHYTPLTVGLHLVHGAFVGDSQLIVETQTRPRTLARIVAALVHPVQTWTGRGRKRHKVVVNRLLYQVAVKVGADAKGRVHAVVHFKYNPAHSIHGTLLVAVRTVTGAATKTIPLTIIHYTLSSAY